MLQEAEMREMLRLLELARAPEITAERAAAVWREVQRRSALDPPSRPAAAAAELLSRLRDRVVHGIRELTASLSPDVLAPSLAVRGAATALPKVLVYETVEHTISISFSGRHGSDRLKLIGQVAPKTDIELPPGGKIAVFSEREMVTGEVDELGEFTLPDVPPGNLHMDILLGTDSIQISPIQTHTVQVMEE